MIIGKYDENLTTEEGIQEDLRQLARIRSLGDLRATDLPRLRAIRCLQIYSNESDFRQGEAQSAAMAVALQTMAPGSYQEAAVAIFGHSEDRWEPLKNRQEDAARAFNVRADAFRRKRGEGRGSRFEEVLFELAVVLESLPVDAVQIHQPLLTPINTALTSELGSESETIDSQHPSWNRATLATKGLIILSVLLGIGLVLLLLVRPWQSESIIPQTLAECPYQPGQTTEDGVVYLDAVALSEELYSFSGGFRQLGCPSGHLQDLGGGEVAYQTLNDHQGMPAGALVVSQDASAITLNHAQWESYRQIGGKSGDSAYNIVGSPRGTHRTDGASWIDFDPGNGAFLVGESIDGPHFFIVKVASEPWMQAGGVGGPLGLPTSNPYTRKGNFTQEFRGGYVDLLSDGSTISVVLVPYEEARSQLPPDEDLPGHILRQEDATGWWINDELERLWIPSNEVFECLGGWDNTAEGSRSIRGHVVQTLLYGGVASCADA